MLRKVGSKEEREALIGAYLTHGYEVVDAGECSALLRRRTWGTAQLHVVFALLSVWWTLGMGNLAYAMVARSRADRVLLRYKADSTGSQALYTRERR